MPTASPSIMANSLVVEDRPKTWPRALIEAMLMPAPRRVVSSSSPAAASEPKVINTTAAMPTVATGRRWPRGSRPR